MFGLKTLGSHHRFHYFKPRFDISLSLSVHSKLEWGGMGVSAVGPLDLWIPHSQIQPTEDRKYIFF